MEPAPANGGITFEIAQEADAFANGKFDQSIGFNDAAAASGVSTEETSQMTRQGFMARQGDVLLKLIKQLPATAEELPAGGWQEARLVLRHGEVTGHAHAFYNGFGEGRVRLFRDDTIGRSYVVIESAPAELRHEEHSTITVPPGVYELPPQLEYDLIESVREVTD